MYRKITLVSESYTQDNIGQFVPTRETRSVWGEVKSVSRNEWFEAGRNGLNPEFIIEMPFMNYNGEEILTIDNVDYAVYRTYKRDTSDIIELYTQKKGGIE